MNEIGMRVAEREIPLGRYRHFKGNEYEVLMLAYHSETEEIMVVYRALYGDRSVWTRPSTMVPLWSLCPLLWHKIFQKSHALC